MSRSQVRHQFMVFDTAIDSHSVLPSTLEEALDDWSQDDRLLNSPSYFLRPKRSEKSLCLPAAPPSTRKSSFEFSDYTIHEKARAVSLSSDGSAPSMVEDHSGFSDSDADPFAEHDPYEESMGHLWDTYETLLDQNDPAEAIIFHRAYLPDYPDDFQSPLPPSSSEVTLPHKASGTQSRIKSQPSRELQAAQRSFIPVPTRNQRKVKVTPRRCKETRGGQFNQTPDPTPVNEAPSLYRSHAQLTARHAPNTLKSLPPSPLKHAGFSLQHSPPKRLRSQPPIHPIPHRQHPAYRTLPNHVCPVTNPCNSSHAYSFHNTPPLPLVEESAFDYDTDDENNYDPVTQLSSSIASKMHIRGLSLGSKLNLTGKKGGNKQGFESTGRRRSATEIVMGVFGLARK